MRARDAAQRLRRFEADEMSRKVKSLEQMILDFESMAGDLARQVHAEEERTGIKDPSHFNYSTFAKSAACRRDNLHASIEELRKKLEDAQRDLDEVLGALDPKSEPNLRPAASRVGMGSEVAGTELPQ